LALASARLHLLTGVERWRDIARGAITAAATMTNRVPANAGTTLQAQAVLEHGATAVVVGDSLLAETRRTWHSELVIVPVAACSTQAWACLDGRRELAGDQVLVCQGQTCRLPAHDVETLRQALR